MCGFLKIQALCETHQLTQHHSSPVVVHGLLLLWSTGSGPTASAVAALWSQQLRLGSWALELQFQ